MPLPPSTTTFIGLIALASMKVMARSRKAGAMSTSSTLPPRGAFGSPARIRSRIRVMPVSPERASAPSRTSFTPV